MNEYSPKMLASLLNQVLKTQKREINGPTTQELKSDWLKSTALEIINLLEKKVKDFNKGHKDRINAQDLIAAVTTTLHLLIKNGDKKITQ